MAKKKKVAKKKSLRGKSKKPKTAKLNPNRGLHAKKLEILEEIPIMPCSLVSADRHGYVYAYTRADEVYQVYRDKCVEKGLTIRRVSGHAENGKYPHTYVDPAGNTIYTEDNCVRYEGVWEIRDSATGQCEQFAGAADGKNEIWSLNSAQTIARKQALLDYFEVPWPQPADMPKVVKKALASLPADQKLKMMKQMIPDAEWNILTSVGAVEALDDFFKKQLEK